MESLSRNSIQLKIARKRNIQAGRHPLRREAGVLPGFVWPTYEGESYDHVVIVLTFLAQFNPVRS